MKRLGDQTVASCCRRLTSCSPMALHPTRVIPSDMISAVLKPASRVWLTACSME